MDTCNCKSKATISTIGGVEKLHSSTCSKETEWKWPKEEERLIVSKPMPKSSSIPPQWKGIKPHN